MEFLEIELFTAIALDGLAKVEESGTADEVGGELARALFCSLDFAERFCFGLVASSHE